MVITHETSIYSFFFVFVVVVCSYMVNNSISFETQTNAPNHNFHDNRYSVDRVVNDETSVF